MQVMMLILETPDDFANRGGGPAAQAYWEKWQAYSAAVNDKIVAGKVLDQAPTAVTIRLRGGERQVQDGPYADSKEALGGYIVFEVETMEEAIELASSCPAAATGAVELRPVVPMDQMA